MKRVAGFALLCVGCGILTALLLPSDSFIIVLLFLLSTGVGYFLFFK